MPNDKEDIFTQQQANVIARNYNLVPYDPLKCERAVTSPTLCSLFFANTSNIVKVLIQYDPYELEFPE